MNRPSKKPQQIAIVGVHRSGTTLVCGMLRECGVNLGHRLDENLEDRSVKWLNEWLLRRAGGAWDHPEPFNLVRRNKTLVDLLIRSRIQEVERRVCCRLSSGQAWAIKDPRLCITLPLWKSFTRDSLIVEVQRDGRDVARSLYSRARRRFDSGYHAYSRHALGIRLWRAIWPMEGYGSESVRCLDINEAFLLWEEYQRQLNATLKEMPRAQVFRVRYETLLQDPDLTLSRLTNFLGIKTSQEKHKNAIRMIKPRRAFGELPEIKMNLIEASSWLQELGYRN